VACAIHGTATRTRHCKVTELLNAHPPLLINVFEFERSAKSVGVRKQSKSVVRLAIGSVIVSSAPVLVVSVRLVGKGVNHNQLDYVQCWMVSAPTAMQFKIAAERHNPGG